MRALFISAIFIAPLHHLVVCYNLVPHDGRSSILKTRRKFVTFTTTSILSPLLLPLSDQNACAAEEYYSMSTIKETAQYIQKYTNENFLRSVMESDCNFLYRGLSPDANKQLVIENSSGLVITDEPFDLLDVETYGSNAAATYFQSLEVQMNANRLTIRPSNSHMGSTCPLEAAKWGTAVSIWPLGEHGVQFAWMEGGGLFWPVPASSESRAMALSDGTQNDDRRLSEALRGYAWEIMFRADNEFLAVPAAFDDELKEILRQ
mmetsp:Transcript_36948/g.75318  ORF Transcript_36948/g.75318 Transcript_36948/m.75318 type:complete len:262 (-) Transcript_36948:1474-2259(-)